MAKALHKVESDAVATQVVPINDGNTPTERQLELINQYVPAGMPRLRESDVIVVPFVAANNLVTRNMGAWTESELYQLTDMLAGKPLMMDHEDEVEYVIGRLIEGTVQRSMSAPADVLDMAGWGEENRTIVQRDGFCQAIMYGYIQSNTPWVDALRYGRLSEVSVGRFIYEYHGCPICKIPLDSPDCPHDFMMPWEDYEDMSEGEYVTYFERKNLIDVMEMSLVSLPACPNAGVVCNQ